MATYGSSWGGWCFNGVHGSNVGLSTWFLAKTENRNRDTPVLWFGQPEPEPGPRFYRGPSYWPVPVTGFLRK
jgi:hypothetical protein